MKKLLLIIACLFILPFTTNASDEIISVNTTSVTILASSTMYGQPIDFSGKHGFFSVQVVITGSGTLTVSYELSNSERSPYTWSTPVSASAIATGLTSGTYLYKFEPYTIGKWLRLSFEETGTSNSATVVSNTVSQ